MEGTHPKKDSGVWGKTPCEGGMPRITEGSRGQGEGFTPKKRNELTIFQMLYKILRRYCFDLTALHIRNTPTNLRRFFGRRAAKLPAFEIGFNFMIDFCLGFILFVIKLDWRILQQPLNSRFPRYIRFFLFHDFNTFS